MNNTDIDLILALAEGRLSGQAEQDARQHIAANPDLGEAVEEVDCSFGGEEVTMGLNPDYLGHFLGAVNSSEVKLALKDENSQAVGTPVEGSDGRYLCVIMPMRI